MCLGSTLHFYEFTECQHTQDHTHTIATTTPTTEPNRGIYNVRDLHRHHRTRHPPRNPRAGPLTGNTEVNFLFLAPYFDFDPLNHTQRERIRAKNKSLRVRFVARQNPDVRSSGMPAQINMTANVSTQTAMSFTTEPYNDKGAEKVSEVATPTNCRSRSLPTTLATLS